MTEPRVWLRNAAIRDFRNLEKVDLSFPETGLAIVGENGQGKTNLLEAIYYLQVLRSARGARGAGPPQWRLKYCTARSCFSAAVRVWNVPRLRLRPVFGLVLRE